MNTIYPYNPMVFQDLQNMRDRIDRQMIQMQQPMQQQQQPQIQQTFQLASNIQSELDSKYATSIEDVKNTLAMKTTVFINKDINTMWIKDITGAIKTYKVEEIIEMDAKDKEIMELKKQLSELKEEISNAKSNVKYDDGNATKQKSASIQSNKSNDANRS